MPTFDKRVGTNGKVTWRVRVRRQGGPPLSKSFARKVDAEAWARVIETRIDSGEQMPAAESRKRTVADAIDRYLSEIYPRSARRKNAREQIRILNWWREEIGTRSLQSVSPSVIADARSNLAKRKSRYGSGLSGSTINRNMAALSAVMKVAVKEFGWLTKNPVTNVTKFAESKGRERFLTDAEREALFTACAESSHPALLPIVTVALATGARKGELDTLQWSGVDLQRRTVRFVDTKNGDSRTVPLAPVAVEALKTWRGKGHAAGAVFPNLIGTIDIAWQAARSRAGLENFRFHDLRHSAASYLAMSGASLMDIAAILGHKTLAMVKRYSHLSEQHTTAAIDRMAAKFLTDSG